MTSLLLGQQAPDFSLPDQDGKVHSLADYKGEWLFIYFYPKDMTRGCVAEAKGIRDVYDTLQTMDVAVLGVSKDSAESHRRFIEKYNLPFPLLVDENQEMMKAYDVWKEKSMFGKKYMGTVRTSFIIDPYGKIVRIYENINTKTHGDEILAELLYLQSEHITA